MLELEFIIVFCGMCVGTCGYVCPTVSPIKVKVSRPTQGSAAVARTSHARCFLRGILQFGREA